MFINFGPALYEGILVDIVSDIVNICARRGSQSLEFHWRVYTIYLYTP